MPHPSTEAPASSRALTVTELNARIRDLLEAEFPDVWVEGEVSDPKTYPSGHTYFTLKDAESQVSAVLFRGNAARVPFKMEHGMGVLARGRVSGYPKRGSVQLIVSALEPRSKGALQVAFEQLKKKLEAEGLFDESRKRPLPLLPRRIGIVTSREGAALRDMLSVLRRRCENLEIVLYPVRVQGDEAKFEIVRALEDLNAQFPELEVLLVGRGGGSLEDLWAFNEEMVARAIAASDIPVVSCVGHETDFTIADFVADLRAPTPSVAAELVAASKDELTERIALLKRRLAQALRHLVSNQELHLRHLVAGRLAPVLSLRTGRLEERFRRLLASPAFRRPLRRIEDAQLGLDETVRSLFEAMKARLASGAEDLSRAGEKLHLLSPLGVLGRGYAIAFSQPGRRVLTDAAKARAGDKLEVRLHKGRIETQILNVFPDKPGKEAP